MTQLKDIKDGDTWLYEEFLKEEIKSHGTFLKERIGSILEARRDWVDRPHHSFYKTIHRITYFLEKIEPGDILMEFDGFPYMPVMSGRAGYVIMRDNKVVEVYVVRMS